MNKLLYSLLICTSLIACNDSETVIKEYSFPPNGWSSSDIVTFTDVHASSDVGTYLRIAHTSEYGYENLYINLTIDTLTKLISVPVMDDMGLWKGIKSSDQYIYDHDISHLLGNLSSTISIEQYSRDPILTEVKSVKLVRKP